MTETFGHSITVKCLRYPESQAHHQLRFQQLLQVLGEIAHVYRADVYLSSYDADELEVIGQYVDR